MNREWGWKQAHWRHYLEEPTRGKFTGVAGTCREPPLSNQATEGQSASEFTGSRMTTAPAAATNRSWAEPIGGRAFVSLPSLFRRLRPPATIHPKTSPARMENREVSVVSYMHVRQSLTHSLTHPIQNSQYLHLIFIENSSQSFTNKSISKRFSFHILNCLCNR